MSGMVVVALALAGPAAAQDRAVNLFVRSGGYSALTDLNDAGTADFNKVGLNVGGGVSVDLNRYVSLRGDFTFGRNELRLEDADTGDELDRFFYDASLQLRYPFDGGLTPYLFVGAGGVTVDPVGVDEDSQTEAAATWGLGVGYTFPASGLGVFVEGRGWAFGMKKLDGMLVSYDKTQAEVAYSAGLSYRLPF